MILIDLEGTTVEWFENYFNSYDLTEHYQHLSGGADSALTLYIMAHCINERNRYDDTIHCVNVRNNDKGYEDDISIVHNIIKCVQGKFPKVKIQLHTSDASITLGNKGPALRAVEKQAGSTDDSIIINSIQQGPPHLSSVGRDANEITHNMSRPYTYVTKKFLAHQYKVFNLMEDLYPLTISCTCPKKFNRPGPCGKCYWCKEKHWAFGSYDGGVVSIMTHILTLKVGTKYGSEYVNNLYRSIKKNSTTPFTLYCYTEDSTGLDEDIIIVPLEDPSEFSLQWHKVKFHKINFANIPTGEKCLILDIDWIITSDMDSILNYQLPERTFGCFERWWSNLRHLCKINGGFQMYYMGDTHRLWMTFSKNPDHWQSYYVKNGLATGPVNGEQNFIDMHVELDREWLPMMWFAKWQEDDWLKIQKNWNEDVSKDEPYYMGGDFAESIKMVHFSNADNLITEAMEKHDWIKDFWN
jgi:7-cyano-7-deazaguanine synthase in queuosine biosynthesis